MMKRREERKVGAGVRAVIKVRMNVDDKVAEQRRRDEAGTRGETCGRRVCSVLRRLPRRRFQLSSAGKRVSATSRG